MALFESYDRRIKQINEALGKYSIASIEDAKKICDEKGIDVIEAFIKGHFASGGTLININVLDGEKLKKAHENPELYPDLVVRVTGFTAYFVSLSPKFRQLVVDRFLYGM
jgi:formate C-acetyltransferase